MSDLPRVHAPGLKVWRAVLLELLRRERGKERPASVADLARAAGKDQSLTSRYLATMEDAHFINFKSITGRHGAEVTLTDLGRLVARIAAADFN